MNGSVDDWRNSIKWNVISKERQNEIACQLTSGKEVNVYDIQEYLQVVSLMNIWSEQVGKEEYFKCPISKAKIVLKSDLDFRDVPCMSIKNFKGVLDGQGHTITGYSCALVSELKDKGEIKNLNIKNATIKCCNEKEMGCIVIKAYRHAKISDVTVDGVTLEAKNWNGGNIGLAVGDGCAGLKVNKLTIKNSKLVVCTDMAAKFSAGLCAGYMYCDSVIEKVQIEDSNILVNCGSCSEMACDIGIVVGTTADLKIRNVSIKKSEIAIQDKQGHALIGVIVGEDQILPVRPDCKSEISDVDVNGVKIKMKTATNRDQVSFVVAWAQRGFDLKRCKVSNSEICFDEGKGAVNLVGMICGCEVCKSKCQYRDVMIEQTKLQDLKVEEKGEDPVCLNDFSVQKRLVVGDELNRLCPLISDRFPSYLSNNDRAIVGLPRLKVGGITGGLEWSGIADSLKVDGRTGGLNGTIGVDMREEKEEKVLTQHAQDLQTKRLIAERSRMMAEVAQLELEQLQLSIEREDMEKELAKIKLSMEEKERELAEKESILQNMKEELSERRLAMEEIEKGLIEKSFALQRIEGEIKDKLSEVEHLEEQIREKKLEIDRLEKQIINPFVRSVVIEGVDIEEKGDVKDFVGEKEVLAEETVIDRVDIRVLEQKESNEQRKNSREEYRAPGCSGLYFSFA